MNTIVIRMESETPTLKNPDLPILIVDDNLAYSKLLRRILEVGFGYNNITAVESTADAGVLFANDPARFKMLFVDFNFPTGQTGGQFLEGLKRHNLLLDKVAFLITSEPSTENVRQATSAGAMGVVAKPFDREELARQLEKAMHYLRTAEADSF